MELTYRNSNNESISISRTGAFRLIDIQGLGKVDADVQLVKSPYQDGSTHIDTLLSERSIVIELGIFAENELQLYDFRRKVSRTFNPKLANGTLRIKFSNGVREIIATPEATVDFPTGADNSTSKFQRVMIELIAPEPYWLSIQEETKPMANWIGGLSFPLQFFGRDLMFAERGTRVKINNDGDVSSPVQVIFKGAGTNPVITNVTTGEFIRVKRQLAVTDSLVINTSFGNKRVEIIDAEGNSTNVFNWLDLNSTFFQLITGVNEIEYSSDSGIEQSTVEIKWRNKYLGV